MDVNLNLNADIANNDLATWAMKDLIAERRAINKDASKGFGDEEALRRVTSEIDRRNATR